MSEEDKGRPPTPLPESEDPTDMIVDDPAASSEDATPEDTPAPRHVTFAPEGELLGGGPLAQAGPSSGQSLQVPGERPRSRSNSPISRIAKFFGKSPPKEASPQTNPPLKPILSKSPPQPSDWPALPEMPREQYEHRYDSFEGRQSVKERISYEPRKEAQFLPFPERAPLATTEDLCSPSGDFDDDDDEPGTSGAATAVASTSGVTTATVHAPDEPMDEPPRRSPPPPPRVPPPPQPAPEPEPEEGAEGERVSRPRRTGEPRQ